MIDADIDDSVAEEQEEGEQGGHAQQAQVAAIANENRLDASLNEMSDAHDSIGDIVDGEIVADLTPSGPNEKKDKFQCPKCARVLKTPSALTSHVITCNGTRPICDLCGKDCIVPSYLERHMFHCPNQSPAEIESKRIACERCGGRYTPDSMHKHKKHCHIDGRLSLECAHCSYIASDHDSLQNTIYHDVLACILN